MYNIYYIIASEYQFIKEVQSKSCDVRLTK